MSIKPAPRSGKNTFAVDTVSRTPLQGRSKASFERMLATARKLMLERGSEEFTLQDVSKQGNVSIGSIYLRFESKENLVRAVIADHLGDIAKAEDAMIDTLRAQSSTLSEFVPRYVEAFAELLREHAPLLRLSMMRAAFDPLVAEPGRASANRAAKLATETMLVFRGEFAGEDNEVRANAAYQIIFATLARQLSLGSTGESVHPQDWGSLKVELGRMCLAYLTCNP
ncbi:TetR/AcrR family transcriptional regulator [Novosphingobium profundi]|uniref:TetR/AcrR family transcriptional regulator n=1 Tax=Novosphingobium profundi TaxID=1774954 RepID=UPI001BD94E83|nr:TetR/AcrR family transcriptional regulator [Novosphingobium profundi]MBT0670916.1 TetR/AcrR family transcriptional regulator [Novosphingobium profundi]